MVQQPIIMRNGKRIPSEEVATFYDDHPGAQINSESLEEALGKRGLEMKMIDVEQEVDAYETDEYSILVPVRSYRWEGYRSAVNPIENVEVLAKQIALSLNLINQPQTFDLFDQLGHRASFSFKHQGDHGNQQQFLYLRRDLATQYLNSEDLRLLWIIWGERRQAPSVAARAESVREHLWRLFGSVRIYNEADER